MLKKLRDKKTAKKIWIVLAVLIVPAFILWGTGSVTRSKQQLSYAGTIFGKKVSLLDYRDAYLAVNNLAIMQFGDNLDQVKKLLNLEAQAWERLILLAEAKKRRISASDKEVIQAIQNSAVFQRKGGFDQKIYEELLQYVFRTPARTFEEQTRQNLILSKLYQEVTVGIKVADAEVSQEYQKANEEISLYYIASLPSDFTKEINPADDIVKDYFDKNSLNFKQPLSFNIEYAAVGAQDQKEDEAKDKIKKVLSRLDKKEEFSGVAKEHNLAVKETGLFSETDPIPGIGWAPQATALISKAKTGEYLPVMRLDNSYYIVRVKEIKAPYIPDFVTIKDKVKEALIKDESQGIARAKIDDTFKKLTETFQADPKSADFEKVAKELGLKSGTTALFKYGSYIEGIGGSDIFWTKANELKEGSFSQALETPSGFYIIKLKDRALIDEKKFNTDKAEFTEKLLSQKKSEYFAQFLASLKTKAKAL